MSTNNPLISVLLCVFNDEKYIQESIESIISQTYKNWELIVIDDGSEDKSYQLLKQIKDSRIHIYRQSNRGLTRSLNIAAGYAKGEFLARQDADDLSLPDRFERQIDLFRQNPSLFLVGSDLAFINEVGEIVEKRTSARNKSQAIKSLGRLNAPFGHGSIMLRKRAFDQVHGYDESYPVSQDFDLILRLSQLDGDMGSVPVILYKWRVHPDSITAKKWWVQFIQALKAKKNVVQMYPNAFSRKNFLRFILIKFFVGFSFIIFSPQAFYFYRLAAQSYNRKNIHEAHHFFKKANHSARISLPMNTLPLVAKILKMKKGVGGRP